MLVPQGRGYSPKNNMDRTLKNDGFQVRNLLFRAPFIEKRNTQYLDVAI